MPEKRRLEPMPAIVFFHGGFNFDAEWVDMAQPFRDAGFVVMFPMLRAANGNPGHFELLLGEIDDARAAVQWLAHQFYIDPDYIYTYGHSSGDRVSLMLSLYDNVPVRLGGGSAGLYTEDSIIRWAGFAPFDVTNEKERRIRAPFDYLHCMKYPYIAHVGRDYPAERVEQFRQLARGTKLDIQQVEGDHMGCLQPAMQRFLSAIENRDPKASSKASGSVPTYTCSQKLGQSRSMDGVLADFDGDGDLDAFVANYGQPNRLWLNDGRGYFADSGQALGHSASHAVACGDLNNDGCVDVFVANVEDQANTIWLNQGNGRLVQTDQILGNASSMSVALGDLDADGDLDAVLGHWSADNQIWLNNGQGRFTLSDQTLGRAITPGIALGDVDGDLDLDIVTGGWQPQGQESANTIWLNNGQAQFQRGVSLQESERRVHAVALTDVDNDSDLDMLLGFGDKEVCVAIWLNEAQGQFRRLNEVKGDGNVHGMALGDLDGDNDMDLILAQGSANQTANSIWFNDGKGKFNASELRLDRAPSNAVIIADLDANGTLDVFVCNYDNNPNTVWLAQSQ